MIKVLFATNDYTKMLLSQCCYLTMDFLFRSPGKLSWPELFTKTRQDSELAKTVQLAESRCHDLQKDRLAAVKSSHHDVLSVSWACQALCFSVFCIIVVQRNISAVPLSSSTSSFLFPGTRPPCRACLCVGK